MTPEEAHIAMNDSLMVRFIQEGFVGLIIHTRGGMDLGPGVRIRTQAEVRVSLEDSDGNVHIRDTWADVGTLELVHPVTAAVGEPMVTLGPSLARGKRMMGI